MPGRVTGGKPRRKKPAKKPAKKPSKKSAASKKKSSSSRRRSVKPLAKRTHAELVKTAKKRGVRHTSKSTGKPLKKISLLRKLKR